MTNEEAIKELELLNRCFRRDSDLTRALEMAMNALKKHQTDDAGKKKITIEEALDAWQRIRNMYENGDVSYVVLLNPQLIDVAIEALKNQPAERKDNGRTD